MGSLSAASFAALRLGAPAILLSCIVLLLLRWKLNLLPLSDDEARTFGTHMKCLRGLCIVCCAAMTASCVAMCGQVGWIGLLVPHVPDDFRQQSCAAASGGNQLRRGIYDGGRHAGKDHQRGGNPGFDFDGDHRRADFYRDRAQKGAGAYEAFGAERLLFLSRGAAAFGEYQLRGRTRRCPCDFGPQRRRQDDAFKVYAEPAALAGRADAFWTAKTSAPCRLARSGRRSPMCRRQSKRRYFARWRKWSCLEEAAASARFRRHRKRISVRRAPLSSASGFRIFPSGAAAS